MQPNSNKSVLNARILPSGQGDSELTRQYPEISGALQALMGVAPDEMGSVLDPKTARLRRYADPAYKAGLAAQVAPLLGPLSKFARGVAAAPSVSAGSRAGQLGVIKAPGGNWLAGSVEDALKGLKRRVPDAPTDAYGRPVENPARNLTVESDSALNNWIDKQLTRYVKNEMATEKDPIRALAEKGMLHYAPAAQPYGPGMNATTARVRAGFPEKGMGESPTAKAWEDISDKTVTTSPAGSWLEDRMLGSDANPHLEANPWLAKVPPDTAVHKWNTGHRTDNLGFNHLIDELRNATNPASGLPPELLLKYSSLPQVSVPQAVERVAKINEWRAAQKAEADMIRANNAATVLHKEYPDKGFRWVELKAPEDEAAFASGARAALDPATGDMRGAGYKALEDALKYEGDTMGHCVGGYCPDVLEGRSRIFSLRSAKGEPHVTIEVAPGRREGERAVDYRQLFPENYAAKYGDDSDLTERIVQIKGKANRAPNPEYLPFVQDFVKSGKWSDVGDLQNAGLRRTSDALNEMELQKLRSLGVEDIPQWLTGEDLNNFSAKLGSGLQYSPDGRIIGGFARGGRVKAKPQPCGCDKGFASGGFVEYDPSAIDSRVNQLRAELAF